MATKLCKVCGCEKPYFPEEKKDSKASGFFGKKCWDCHLDADRVRMQGIRSTEDGWQKSNAATIKYQAKRRKTDAWYRLRLQLAGETNRLLKDMAVGKGTDYMCLKIFGADRETVFARIDAQLQARGFKWENHGTEWQLDHRKPLGLAQSSIELYQLCLLENTQVLSPEENRAKSVEDRELIRQHENQV